MAQNPLCPFSTHSLESCLFNFDISGYEFSLKENQLRRKGLHKRFFAKHRYLNSQNAKPGAHDFVIILDGLKPDFNIGKIFRTADAMGCREVHLIGIDFFNVFPSRGSFKHVPAKFHKNFQECYEPLKKEGYEFFRLEASGESSLAGKPLPSKSAFIFGHEEFGFSFDPKEFVAVSGLRVPQFGRVQCLNVSIAAALTMYEYVRQRVQAGVMKDPSPFVGPAPSV